MFLIAVLMTYGQWTYTTLTQAKSRMGVAVNGTKVYFAGGNNIAGSAYSVVDVYDMATGDWIQTWLSQARSCMGAAVAGDLAFFAGGYLDPTSSVTNRVDVYHFSTGTWTQETLSEARGFLAAATVGNKVLFAGGTRADNTPSDRVDIYDVETGYWDIKSLSEARALFPLGSAVTCDNKAYFLPGGHFDLYAHNWTTDFNVIDIYDASLDLWYVDELSASKLLFSVAGAEDHLIVAGGAVSPGWNFSDNVEIFSDPDYPDCIPSGIPGKLEETTFTVYPNPCSGKIFMDLNGLNMNDQMIATIYDMQGKQVIHQSMAKDQHELNLPLPAGVYLLRITAGEEVFSELITIQ